MLFTGIALNFPSIEHRQCEVGNRTEKANFFFSLFMRAPAACGVC